jgi:Na+-driven multidrug efflux pump
MNLILGKFSSTAIAVYGIYFKLNSFIFMPIFGLNNGIVPIIAYNYGSKDKERIFKTIKISLIIAILIMLLGTLIFIIFPKYLLRIFKASEEMLQYGIPALRIISLSFIGAAISISLSSVFQAFGKAFYSMIISFIRQLFVLLPFAYIFSLSGNINNIWFCFPIAEFAAIILSILYMIKIKKDIISKL